MWDIRRLLSWVRGQDPRAVGAMGLSLGGYNTALLAGLEPGLACAIAGIPATDLPRLLVTLGVEPEPGTSQDAVLSGEKVAEIYRVVSPLVLEPRVPFENRAIFSGVADRLVTPDQVRDLHTHWGEPRIAWYQGGHMTFSRDADVKDCVLSTLIEAGLVSA